MTLTPAFINGHKYAIETHPGLEPCIHALGDGLAMSAFSEDSRRVFRAALAGAWRPDPRPALTEDQRIVLESFLTLCSILREPPDRYAVMLTWQSEGITRIGMQFADENQVGALTLDEWGSLL